MNSVDNPEEVLNWSTDLGKRHKKKGIKLDYFPHAIEAVIETLKYYMKERWTPEHDEAFAIAFPIIAKPILAPYKAENPGGLTDGEIDDVQNNWKKIEEFGVEKVGLQLFRNFFSINPEILALFPFAKTPNLYQTAEFRNLAVKIMRVFSKVIQGLTNIESVKPLLSQRGNAHVGLGVVPEHYDAFGELLISELSGFFGSDWTQKMESNWVAVYGVIREIFEADHYKHDEDGNVTLNEHSERNLLENDYDKKSAATAIVQEQRDQYLKVFRKEVDFHHKVAYRFEKAYRLGKKMPDRKGLLNIEIIDIISDH